MAIGPYQRVGHLQAGNSKIMVWDGNEFTRIPHHDDQIKVQSMPIEYKLLDGPYPIYAPTYRGLMRREPVYDYGQDESHPVNQAFREYMDKYRLFIPTLADALRLYTLFQGYGHQFEIIQVERLDDEPTDNVAGFLGYDVFSEEEGSFLATGFPPESDESSPYAILWNLARDCFLPRLNNYGLFESWAVAHRHLAVIQALGQVFPERPWTDKASTGLAVYRLSIVKPAMPIE